MGIRSFLDRWANQRSLLVAMVVLTYSAQSLLIASSKHRTGGFAYDTTSVVFLAEFFKLVFAVAMLDSDGRNRLFGFPPNSSCSQNDISRLDAARAGVPYVVPALLYAVQNHLMFEAHRFVTPPEYQLLSNMKLFTTSIVYRVVMKRQILVVQWLALLLLAVAMGLTTALPDAIEEAFADVKDVGVGVNQDSSFVHFRGVVIMTVVSWLSACAGVMNEWLIKRSTNPHQSSCWLYASGSLLCGLQLGASGGWVRLFRFEGFTATTWLVVVCNAAHGQTIDFLYRHADTIVKLYAVCGAMGFTALVSVLFFGVGVAPSVLPGYIVVAVSMCLYYGPPEVLCAADSEIVAKLRAAAPGNGVDSAPADSSPRFEISRPMRIKRRSTLKACE